MRFDELEDRILAVFGEVIIATKKKISETRYNDLVALLVPIEIYNASDKDNIKVIWRGSVPLEDIRSSVETLKRQSNRLTILALSSDSLPPLE